jgi:hypothetical protein
MKLIRPTWEGGKERTMTVTEVQVLQTLDYIHNLDNI